MPYSDTANTSYYVAATLGDRRIALTSAFKSLPHLESKLQSVVQKALYYDPELQAARFEVVRVQGSRSTQNWRRHDIDVHRMPSEIEKGEDHYRRQWIPSSVLFQRNAYRPDVIEWSVFDQSLMRFPTGTRGEFQVPPDTPDEALAKLVGARLRAFHPTVFSTCKSIAPYVWAPEPTSSSKSTAAFVEEDDDSAEWDLDDEDPEDAEMLKELKREAKLNKGDKKQEEVLDKIDRAHTYLRILEYTKELPLVLAEPGLALGEPGALVDEIDEAPRPRTLRGSYRHHETVLARMKWCATESQHMSVSYTGYEENLIREFADLYEDLTATQALLKEAAERGTFLPWGPEHLNVGDFVTVAGGEVRVTEIGDFSFAASASPKRTEGPSGTYRYIDIRDHRSSEQTPEEATLRPAAAASFWLQPDDRELMQHLQRLRLKPIPRLQGLNERRAEWKAEERLRSMERKEAATDGLFDVAGLMVARPKKDSSLSSAPISTVFEPLDERPSETAIYVAQQLDDRQWRVLAGPFADTREARLVAALLPDWEAMFRRSAYPMTLVEAGPLPSGHMPKGVQRGKFTKDFLTGEEIKEPDSVRVARANATDARVDYHGFHSAEPEALLCRGVFYAAPGTAPERLIELAADAIAVQFPTHAETVTNYELQAPPVPPDTPLAVDAFAAYDTRTMRTFQHEPVGIFSTDTLSGQRNSVVRRTAAYTPSQLPVGRWTPAALKGLKEPWIAIDKGEGRNAHWMSLRSINGNVLTLHDGSQVDVGSVVMAEVWDRSPAGTGRLRFSDPKEVPARTPRKRTNKKAASSQVATPAPTETTTASRPMPTETASSSLIPEANSPVATTLSPPTAAVASSSNEHPPTTKGPKSRNERRGLDLQMDALF